MRDGFLNWILFLPIRASTFATRVDHLHQFVIITTMVASSAIGLTALYFVIRYHRRDEDTSTLQVTSPPWMEAIIIGLPLSLFLLFFSIGFHDFVWYRTPPKDSMDVYVTAKKWMWKFSYPGGPNAIGVLTVPSNRPVRLLLTSRDVIHSFFVPAFRIKQDAVPGRYTETWFEATRPGNYEVLCAEYCGIEHSMMRAEVRVLKASDFEDWLAVQQRGLARRVDSGEPKATPTIVAQGELAAERYGCLKCHTVDGTSHIGPTWRDLYLSSVPLDSGKAVIADEAYLTESMMDPMAKVVAGYKPIMPTFQGVLTAPDAAAIVEYIKSLSPKAQPPASSGVSQ